MSAPINVLLVALRFPPEFSGAAIRFLRYAPGLARRGVRLRAIVLRSSEGGISSEGRLEASFLQVEQVMGVEVLPVSIVGGCLKRRHSEFARIAANYCQENERDIDVIHILRPTISQVLGFGYSRRVIVPLVGSVTLLDCLSGNRLRRIPQRLLRRFPLQRMDRVLVQSKVAESHTLELGVSKPITVIPNGVDLSRFHPPAKGDEVCQLRVRLGLALERPIVIFLGSVTRRKGADILLRARDAILSKCSDTLFLFVGPSRDELLKEGNIGGDLIPELQAALDSPDSSIVFTGRVDNVEDYLRAADLLAFPSEREGMPNAVLEAFGSGLASVVTPFVGLSEELGRPGIEYLLVDRNPEDLARGIVEVLTCDSLRKRLGVAARSWAEENLDVEDSLDRYAEFYKELVKKGGVCEKCEGL